MSEGNITRISAQEALRRIERGESLTDWARVRAMSEQEVGAAAAADPDWQDVDPDWVAKAEPVRPVSKRRLTLALDEDVVDWFRSQDRHYRSRMNQILRAYMQRHRSCCSKAGRPVRCEEGLTCGTLAERTGLTAYDASYLWLARRMRSELVTLERQLEAAGATGLRGRAISPRRP